MQDFSLTTTQALAYLGDSVLESIIRERLILKGIEKSGKLNAEALKYVTAVNQAKAYEKIEALLTEKEAEIFRRGRNSCHINVPKSASIKEYKIATGFEAIFGYLRLCKDEDRILFLFNSAYDDLN